MSADKVPAWVLKAEAQYLAGGVTLKQLADKIGKSERTLERWASKRSWDSKRRDVVGKVSGELPVVVERLVLESTAAIVAEHFNLWELGRKKALDLLEGVKMVVTKTGDAFEVPAVEDPKALAQWAQAVKAITEGQRLAAGLVDPSKAKEAVPVDDEDGPRHGVLMLPEKDLEPVPPQDESPHAEA